MEKAFRVALEASGLYRHVMAGATGAVDAV
jgi:hypothetical protein